MAGLKISRTRINSSILVKRSDSCCLGFIKSEGAGGPLIQLKPADCKIKTSPALSMESDYSPIVINLLAGHEF